MPQPRKGIVRYAVVGPGHIAQVAMLPAFAHARRNSRLTALVSDDRAKLKQLAERYNVEHTRPLTSRRQRGHCEPKH